MLLVSAVVKIMPGFYQGLTLYFPATLAYNLCGKSRFKPIRRVAVTAGSQDFEEHCCAAAILILESWQQG